MTRATAIPSSSPVRSPLAGDALAAGIRDSREQEQEHRPQTGSYNGNGNATATTATVGAP